MNLLDQQDDRSRPIPNAAHGTSRSTSSRAKADPHSLSDRLLRFIQERGTRGATDAEIQDALELDGNSEQPCRVDLEKRGYIFDSGRTRKTQSGRSATIWVTAEFRATREPAQPSLRANGPPALSMPKRMQESIADRESERLLGPELDAMSIEEIENLAAAVIPAWPSAFGRQWTPESIRKDSVGRKLLLLQFRRQRGQVR